MVLSGGSLSDTWGRESILLASFVISLIAYLGFALADNIFLVAVLLVFYGVHQGIFRAVGKALTSDCVPEHLRAGGVGWYSTTVGVRQLVASIVAGLLWDRMGHAAVFYDGAVGSIALLLLIPREREEERPRPPGIDEDPSERAPAWEGRG